MALTCSVGKLFSLSKVSARGLSSSWANSRTLLCHEAWAQSHHIELPHLSAFDGEACLSKLTCSSGKSAITVATPLLPPCITALLTPFSRQPLDLGSMLAISRYDPFLAL